MNTIDGSFKHRAMPTWEIEEPREQLPRKEPAFNEWPQKGGTFHPVFYRLGERFLIRFSGLGDFVVSKNADKINATPVPGVSHGLLKEAYHNLVFPLALSQQKRLVFHASAVEIDHSSVVFIANSGAGKSTLATNFATNGYRFLADDCVWLHKHASGFQVMPGHPSLRIWEDSFETLKSSLTDIGATKSYNGKWQLGLSQTGISAGFHCAEPRALKNIYFLKPNSNNEIQIKSLTTQQAVVGLLSHRFLLDFTSKPALSTDIKDISALARASACFQLSIPRAFDALPDIRSRIIAHTRRKLL